MDRSACICASKPLAVTANPAGTDAAADESRSRDRIMAASDAALPPTAAGSRHSSASSGNTSAGAAGVAVLDCRGGGLFLDLLLFFWSLLKINMGGRMLLYFEYKFFVISSFTSIR